MRLVEAKKILKDLGAAPTPSKLTVCGWSGKGDQ